MKNFVLVVEDYPLWRGEIVQALEGRGFRAEGVSHPFSALDRLREVSPDAILTDLHLPGMDGLMFYERSQIFAPKTPFVFVSVCPEAFLSRFPDRGNFLILRWPLKDEDLDRAVKHLLTQKGDDRGRLVPRARNPLHE